MHDVTPVIQPFRLATAPDQPVGLAAGTLDGAVALPLVECLTLEHGRCFVDHRLTQTTVGSGLRPVRREPLTSPWPGTRVIQHDRGSDLTVTVDLWHPTSATLHGRTTVHNDGKLPVHLTAVSIMCASLLSGAELDDLDILIAPSAWMAEQRWTHHRLSDLLVDVGTELHGESPRDRFVLSSESGWSSGRWEPVGFITDPASGRAVGWQIEHNGGWTVELARRSSTLGLCLFGPTDLQHHWMHQLNPGETFTTPAVTLVVSDNSWQGAAAELSTYRRVLRGNNGTAAPIVFNDYMNTLMADPTAERLSTLIPAAARTGAEVYCIDAGWHSDDTDWWDDVGRWEPSPRRFPGGLRHTLDLIVAYGMTPGLWIEPLAVGLRSPLVNDLPPEAFMRRAGVPIVEQNRVRLDMRNPQARAHLDTVIDRMVSYGIGYLKIDDNFSVGSGPDEDADSPGDGLLGHCRAWAAWLADLPRRHPGLVVENCASGGHDHRLRPVGPSSHPVDIRPPGFGALPAHRRQFTDDDVARTSRQLGLPTARHGRRGNRLYRHDLLGRHLLLVRSCRPHERPPDGSRAIRRRGSQGLTVRSDQPNTVVAERPCRLGRRVGRHRASKKVLSRRGDHCLAPS